MGPGTSEIANLDVRAIVGANIRSWRKRRGMPLKSVANKVGCSLQAISQIERGVIDAKTSTLIAIAEALEVSPAEFFHGASSKLNHNSAVSPHLSNLITAAMKLPASWQQLLAQFAEKGAIDFNWGNSNGRAK